MKFFKQYKIGLFICTSFGLIVLIFSIILFYNPAGSNNEIPFTKELSLLEDSFTNDLLYRNYSDADILNKGSSWYIVDDIPNIENSLLISVIMLELNTKTCHVISTKKNKENTIDKNGVYKFYLSTSDQQFIDLKPYIKIEYGYTDSNNEETNKNGVDLLN